MTSSSIIISNALVHIIISIRSFKKEGLTLRSFIWLYLTVFTIASVFILKTGIYEIVMESDRCSESESISWMPYLLNIVFTYILVKPLGLINPQQFLNGIKVSLKGNDLIRKVLFVSFLFSLMKLYQLSVVSSIGFGNFHEYGRTVQLNFLYGGSVLLKGLNTIGRGVNICIAPFVVGYLISRWKCGSIRFNECVKFFALYAFNTISVGLVAGSRATMLYGFLDIIFFCLLFFNWFPKKVRNIGVASILTALVGTIVIFVIIGGERFDGVPPIFNFLSYLGQSYLNLGFEFWKHLKVHTYGAITMGGILGIELPEYFATTGVHDDWFHTAYGSFFEDFGPIVPILIALLISKLFIKYIGKGRKMGIEQIIVMLFYFQLCYQIPFGVGFDFFYIFSLFMVIWLPKYLKPIFYYKQTSNNNLKK